MKSGNRTKLRMYAILALTALMLVWGAAVDDLWASGQKPLHYDVSVVVKVIPVFAVDSAGNPVYDLKQDELELFINDVSVKIADFRRFSFEDERIVERTIKRKVAPKPAPAQKRSDRVVFVIIDSIYNSHNGMKRSKKIAEGLLTKSPPGDTIILLLNTPAGGLKYLATCTNGNCKAALDLIHKIKMPHEKWSRDIFQSREYDNFTDFGLRDPGTSTKSLKDLQNQKLLQERWRYQNQVKSYTQSLAQLKYALSMISKPKIVYLISEGIAKGAFRADLSEKEGAWSKNYSSLLKDEKNAKDNSVPLNMRMYKYLLDVVKAINYGGSVLYTINPVRIKTDDENVGDMSLRTMAGESGGRHFAGSNIETVIQELKKNTAAYYELVFSIKGVPEDGMRVHVECKRPGVVISTLNHSQREKPYVAMEPLKKKLFALDVVNGGNWSRIAGKVVHIPLASQKTVKDQKSGKVFARVSTLVPKLMQGKALDIYSLWVDRKTGKAEIDVVNRVVGNSVTMQFLRRNHGESYVVMVEPKDVYCVYSQIK